jgi:hypothetical protein
MRTPILVRLGAILGGLVLALSLGAASALAKEGVSVSLAAPIPADAQPGDVVAVFFTLTSISDAGEQPLRGSPAFIRLHGSGGAMTEAGGVETATPGTYKAMIEIPAGGALRAEFGIHGAATDGSGSASRSDLVWAYDGILVAAKVPDPVDPNTFTAPGAKPAQANPAQAATPGSTAPAAATSPALDARLGIAVGLVAVALAAALVIGRRRRRLQGAAA